MASQEESSTDLLECSICMEEFMEGNKPRVLPCTHVYCTTCITRMAREKAGVITCPECREKHKVMVKELKICRTTMKLREITRTNQKKREAACQKQKSDRSASSRTEIKELLSSFRTSIWEASQSGKILEEAVDETRRRRETLHKTMAIAEKTVADQMNQVIRAAEDRKKQLNQYLKDAFQESLTLLGAMEDDFKGRQENHERFCREMKEKEAALRGDDWADPEEVDRLIQETQDRDKKFYSKISIPLKKLSLDTHDDRHQSVLADISSLVDVKTEHITHEVPPVNAQTQPIIASMAQEGANHYVAKTKATRTIGDEPGSPLESPSCVAELPNGDIAIGSSMNYQIRIVDSGSETRVISLPPGDHFNDGITGICVTPDGKLCISNPDLQTVHIVTPEGTSQGGFETYLPPLKEHFRPWGLACNKEGEVFVCDRANHLVRVYDKSGRECRRFGGLGDKPGQLRSPWDVAVTPDGEVAVADTGNHRIQVFDGATGKYQATFGSSGSGHKQLKGVAGIAVDSAGFVAVAEKHNKRVQLFTPRWKSFHMLTSQEEPFELPCALTITKGNEIVVCDKRKNTLQIF